MAANALSTLFSGNRQKSFSRTNGRNRTFRSGGWVHHVSRHVWSLSKIKRSKVKVTRSRNVLAAKALSLGNRWSFNCDDTYETFHHVAPLRIKSPTSAKFLAVQADGLYLSVFRYIDVVDFIQERGQTGSVSVGITRTGISRLHQPDQALQ